MSRSRITVALVIVLVAAGAARLQAQNFPPATKEAEAELLGVLTSADASREAKATALRRLAVVGTKDAVPVLAGLLTDADLSHMARYALEPIPDPSVDAALRSALGKAEGRVKVGIIGSLGVRRDPKAVPALVNLLQSADQDVALAASRALGTIGTPDAVQALQDALPGRTRELQLHLCEGLLRAAEGMCDAGKPGDAVPVYDRLRGLKDAPHQVRTAGVRGAILARGRLGLPLLAECLASDDYIVFSAACRATHEMREPGATKALAEALGRGPADRQILILQAMGRRGEKGALPAVFKAAKDGEKAVRLQAIQAVAEIADPAAADDLVALMGDADGDVAREARESLASLPGEKVDAAVMGMFRSEDAGRKAAAIDLIGRRRMTAAVPDLLKAARTDDAGVQSAALRQLGELAGPDRLPAILDLLMAAEGGALGAAQQATSDVCAKANDAEPCAARVAALLPKADAAHKVALLGVLGSVGGETALKAVRGAVGDADSNVHTTAIRTLGGWKTPDAVPALLEVARTAENPRDKTLALRGYLGWASRGRDGLPPRERLRICQTAAGLAKSAGEKKLLLGALGQIRSPEAVDMILAYVDDAEVRTEACSAALSVAEELLKVGGGKKFAPRLVEPLEKVAGAATGDLAGRAKALLNRARKIAGQK
jgi:HEAT repeat protein